jgi:hypothetical protein
MIIARYDARKEITHEPSEMITLTQWLSCVGLPPQGELPMTSSLVGYQNQTAYVGRTYLRLRF